MYCLHCGAALHTDDIRCPACGTPVPASDSGSALRKDQSGPSLMWGILSLFFSCTFLCPLSIVFGIIAIRKSYQADASVHGIALAGRITGIAGLSIGGLISVLLLILIVPLAVLALS